MGAQSSRSSTRVASSIKGSIKSVMDSEVNGAVTLACSNQQIVKDAEGCDIEFAEQMCQAVGISNFTGAQSQTANVSQDVMNEIVAGASAATSGMTVGFNASSSSSFVKSMVDMSMDVSQSFMMDCTKSIQAINNQTVEGCSAGSVIRFKPQQISAEVIGDCVVNQVADLAAAQKLTSAISAYSDATTSGIDFFSLAVVGMICLTVFLIGMPFAAKTMSSAVLGDGAEGAANRTRMIMSLFAGTFLLLSGLFWWPGIPGASGASVYGVWPHEPVWLEEDSNTCFQGKNIDRDTFINEYIWYDPYCLSQLSDGEPQIGSCSDSDKLKHYKGCGLFATTPACDDPQYVQDKAAYLEIIEACGAPLLRGNPTVMKGTCDAAHLATMFSDASDDYQGCTRCLEGDLRGMWVGEGQACSADRVSLYDYARFATDDPDTNERCDPSDPNCKETTDILARTSPGDCMNLTYQRKKKTFSAAVKACDRIDKAAKRNTASNGGVRPTMANQCPPSIFDYMTKCSESTKKCSYAARSSDPLVGGACTNDFSVCCSTDATGQRVCNDQDYARDLDTYDIANAKCAAKWDTMDGFYYTPHLSMTVYALLGAAVLYTWVRAPAGTTAQIASGMSTSVTTIASGGIPLLQSTLFRLVILVAMMGLAIGAGFPIGILAIIYHDWPVSIYDESDRTSGDRWESIGWAVAGWGLLGVSVVGMLFVAYLFFFSSTKVVKEVKGKASS